MTRNYVQIGAGGTGSFLFPALARYLETYKNAGGGEYTITLIDGKEVAASKLERQLFFGRHVGDNKAQALAEQYETDPKVIIAVPEYLGPKNISGLHNGDVILIAADNFPVRARIEKHCLKLDNVTVINGGNEMIDGSLQTWIRRDGSNITPPLSQGHPEILRKDKDDPAALSCQQIAELPGGQQTIIANMMSATAMLNAVRLLHDWETTSSPEEPPSEEVFFDLNTVAMRAAKRPQGVTP
ncbi:MAG: ThiF family adenylyltransferase [Acidimicrobiia bacterium]